MEEKANLTREKHDFVMSDEKLVSWKAWKGGLSNKKISKKNEVLNTEINSQENVVVVVAPSLKRSSTTLFQHNTIVDSKNFAVNLKRSKAIYKRTSDTINSDSILKYSSTEVRAANLNHSSTIYKHNNVDSSYSLKTKNRETVLKRTNNILKHTYGVDSIENLKHCKFIAPDIKKGGNTIFKYIDDIKKENKNHVTNLNRSSTTLKHKDDDVDDDWKKKYRAPSVLQRSNTTLSTKNSSLIGKFKESRNFDIKTIKEEYENDSNVIVETNNKYNQAFIKSKTEFIYNNNKSTSIENSGNFFLFCFFITVKHLLYFFLLFFIKNYFIIFLKKNQMFLKLID